MPSVYTRGKTVYVRFMRPDSTRACESRDENGNRFPNESAAYEWGLDQESDIRRGQWKDPRAGQITFAAWVEKWWPAYAAGLAMRTRKNYLYAIEIHLLPRFGDMQVGQITPVDVATWEQETRAEGYANNTVNGARARLVTILGDAVAQELIRTNPALKPRRRGRAKGAEESQEKVWPMPLQTLLHAERCALLSGRDDDFVMQMVMAYTGMRWAEVLGLQWRDVALGTLRVEWQLIEDGRFYLQPPKYGSRRTLDIPPLIAEMLSDLRKARSEVKCRCGQPKVKAGDHPEEPCPGGRAHVFLGDKGGHPRASNYRDRIFYPAAHGQFPEMDGARPRPAKPVMADVAAGWPGVPVPGWPKAVAGEQFVIPRGHGVRVYDPEAVHLVSWLAVLVGLTPHGERHGHQVWMDDLITVSEKLKVERMGHKLEGVRAVYKHASDPAREELRAGLQELLKGSLRDRAAISPRSPVAMLDRLLEPHRQQQLSPRKRLERLRMRSA